MWKAAFGGRSERGDRSEAGSVSGGRKKKSRSGAESVVSSSTRKSRDEDKERRRRSTRSVYDDDDARSSYGGATSRSGGGLTESAIRALNGGNDDDWEDDDKYARSERKSRAGGERRESRRKSTRSEKDRSRSRSRDRRDDKKRRESDRRDSERRDSDRKESDKSRGKTRADPDIVDERSTTRALPSGGFDQFPGQHAFDPIQSYNPVMSGALPSAPNNQFYGHEASFPTQPPVPTRSDSYGHAADYYVDQGESVGYQPGMRIQSPNMLANPDLHLATPSAVPQPAQDTGHGAAADYYGTAVEDMAPVVSTQQSSSKPDKKTRPTSGTTSKPSKSTNKPSSSYTSNSTPSKLAGAGFGTVAAAAIAATDDTPSRRRRDDRRDEERRDEERTSSYQQTQTTSYTETTEGRYSSVARPSGSVYQNNNQYGTPTPTGYPGPQGSSAPINGQYNNAPQPVYYGPPTQAQAGKQSSHSNVPLYAAGAAAAGLAAYEMHEHNKINSNQANATSYYGSGQRPSQPPVTPMGPGSRTNGQGAMGTQHFHEHKGPITRIKDGLLDLVSTPEDVRRMEDYTEYIGVCKYCFDPRASPYDGPRRHHHKKRDSFENLRRRRSGEQMRRKGSNESLRKTGSTRIDKENRYYASDDKRRRSGNGALGAGLAAAGVAAGANAYFHDGKDFNDTYSVKSGKYERSAARRRSRSSSHERRRRSSFGVTGKGREEEWVTVRTKEGKVERRRVVRKSRSKSRSSSRERKGNGLFGAVAGAALGAGVASAAASSSKRRHSPKKQGAFVRRRSRSSSSSSRSRSPGLAEILGFSNSKPKRNGRQSPVNSYYDISHRPRQEESTGIFGGFFTPPQRGRTVRRGSKERRKKKNGFFTFSNSSSSSNEGMAFGEGFASRTSLPLGKKPSRQNSDERIAETIAGIGATAAALEAAKKARSSNKRISRPEIRGRNDDRTKRYSHSLQANHSEEDEWEDEVPSDGEHSSSGDSALAFGGSTLSKRHSMESVSSGDGLSAWGWRWGGKDKKKKRRSSSLSLYQTTSHEPEDGKNGYPDSRETSNAPTGPLKYVDPRPIVDDTRIGSMPGAFDDVPVVRPGPGPLQQPKPVSPKRAAFVKNSPDTNDRFSNRPTPTRTQSSPTRSNFVEDATLIGGAALVTAGIIASQSRKGKEPANVRFGLTEEQQRRDDRERRRENERAEEERRRADRTRALKEEADRNAREQDALRREEDVRRKREDENRRAAEEELARRREQDRLADERARERRAEEQRRDEQNRRDREAKAAEEAARVESSRRADRDRASRKRHEYENENESELDKKRRETDHQQDYQIELRQENSRDQARKIDERDSKRSEDNRSKRSSGGWGSVVAGATVAAATAGAVAAGYEHEKSKRDTRSREDDHLQYEPQEAYVAKQITPDDTTSGTAFADDDIFDRDFFKRKRSDSEFARESRQAEIAQKAADKVIADLETRYDQPSQSQADFFKPKELMEDTPVDDKAIWSGPNADNDIPVYNAEVRLPSAQLGYIMAPGKSRHAPYGVPSLSLISPTPPPSQAGSVRGKGSAPPSPLARAQDAEPVAVSKEEKEERRKSITWGDDEINVYQDQTPDYADERDSYITSRDLPKEKNDKVDEIVVEETAPKSGKKNKKKNKKTTYHEDEFKEAPSVPEVNVDKAEDLPPQIPPLYRQPFYDSVSDIGVVLDSPGTEGAPPVKGFVEGEIGEAIPTDKVPHIPGGFDDEVYEGKTVNDDEVQAAPINETSAWEPPLSKKEQKKREKAAKRASLAESDPVVSEAVPETASREISVEPEVAEFSTPLSKKDKKKKDKGSKRNSVVDSEPSTPIVEAEPEPAPEPTIQEPTTESTEWEPPLSKKEKKKREKAAQRSSTLDSEADNSIVEPEATEETPVEQPQEDAWAPTLSKKEQKKRDKAARLSQAFESEADNSVTDPEPVQEQPVEPAEASWEPPLSKKEQKKRDKAARLSQAFEDETVTPPVEPTPVEEATVEPPQAEFEVLPAKKDKKKRGKVAQLAEAFESDSSSPAEDKSASRDVSVDRAPGEESAWAPPLSKKEQKKRDKAARLSQAFEADETQPVEPAEPVTEETSSARDIVAEPETTEPAWEPPLSKKELKKREKAKRASMVESEPDVSASEKAEPPHGLEQGEEPAWEPPLTKKEKKKREKALRDSMGSTSSPPPELDDEMAEEERKFFELERAMEENEPFEDNKPKLSKKEQKKADKEAKKSGFGDIAAALMTTAGVTALATSNDDKDKESDWDSPSGKKSKKGKKKTTESDSERDIRDIEPTNEPSSMPGGWDSDTARSPEAVDPFQFQVKDDPPAPEVDDWNKPSDKKSKKKKKRESGLFNEPSASSPLRTEWKFDDYMGDDTTSAKPKEDQEGSRGDDEWSRHAEGVRVTDSPRRMSPEDNRRMSKEERRSRSAASEPTTDLQSKRGSTIRVVNAASDIGYTEEPESYDVRPVAESEPIDPYESARNTRRGSKYDDDDMASVVSSRSRKSRDDSASGKKEKKGGFFGLFSRNKSVDVKPEETPLPLSRQTTRESRDGDDLDGEKKHRRRSKHRDGSLGSGVDDDRRSVTSESHRRRSRDDRDDDTRSTTSGHRHRRHRDDGDEDSRERRRSSKYSDDFYDDARSESGSRHRHRHRDRDDENPSDSKDQSFLGSRVEDLPPLPVSPSESQAFAPINEEQGTGNPASAEPETSKSISDSVKSSEVISSDVSKEAENPDLAVSTQLQPDALQAPKELGPNWSWADEVENPSSFPLPASRSTSPNLQLVTPPRPEGPQRASTAVPLRFPFGTKSRPERAKSFGSPAAASSTSTSPSSAKKKGRPSSNEFKPLYLVEKNRKPAPEVEQTLPSLPSSKPSSRSSSINGSEIWHSAAEDPGSPESSRELKIDIDRANTVNRDSDLLNSAETTPKASDFQPPALRRPVRGEPQYYTWEDFAQDERLHEQSAAGQYGPPLSNEADVNAQPVAQDYFTPRPIGEELPPLPASRPESSTSRQENLEPSHSSTIKGIAAGAALAGAGVLAYNLATDHDTDPASTTKPEDKEISLKEELETSQDPDNTLSRKASKKKKGKKNKKEEDKESVIDTPAHASQEPSSESLKTSDDQKPAEEELLPKQPEESLTPDPNASVQTEDMKFEEVSTLSRKQSKKSKKKQKAMAWQDFEDEPATKELPAEDPAPEANTPAEVSTFPEDHHDKKLVESVGELSTEPAASELLSDVQVPSDDSALPSLLNEDAGTTDSFEPALNRKQSKKAKKKQKAMAWESFDDTPSPAGVEEQTREAELPVAEENIETAKDEVTPATGLDESAKVESQDKSFGDIDRASESVSFADAKTEVPAEETKGEESSEFWPTSSKKSKKDKKKKRKSQLGSVDESPPNENESFLNDVKSAAAITGAAVVAESLHQPKSISDEAPEDVALPPSVDNELAEEVISDPISNETSGGDQHAGDSLNPRSDMLFPEEETRDTTDLPEESRDIQQPIPLDLDSHMQDRQLDMSMPETVAEQILGEQHPVESIEQEDQATTSIDELPVQPEQSTPADDEFTWAPTSKKGKKDKKGKKGKKSISDSLVLEEESNSPRPTQVDGFTSAEASVPTLDEPATETVENPAEPEDSESLWALPTSKKKGKKGKKSANEMPSETREEENDQALPEDTPIIPTDAQETPTLKEEAKKPLSDTSAAQQDLQESQDSESIWEPQSSKKKKGKKGKKMSWIESESVVEDTPSQSNDIDAIPTDQKALDNEPIQDLPQEQPLTQDSQDSESLWSAQPGKKKKGKKSKKLAWDEPDVINDNAGSVDESAPEIKTIDDNDKPLTDEALSRDTEVAQETPAISAEAPDESSAVPPFDGDEWTAKPSKKKGKKGKKSAFTAWDDVEEPVGDTDHTKPLETPTATESSHEEVAQEILANSTEAPEESSAVPSFDDEWTSKPSKKKGKKGKKSTFMAWDDVEEPIVATEDTKVLETPIETELGRDVAHSNLDEAKPEEQVSAETSSMEAPIVEATPAEVAEEQEKERPFAESNDSHEFPEVAAPLDDDWTAQSSKKKSKKDKKGKKTASEMIFDPSGPQEKDDKLATQDEVLEPSQDRSVSDPVTDEPISGDQLPETTTNAENEWDFQPTKKKGKKGKKNKSTWDEEEPSSSVTVEPTAEEFKDALPTPASPATEILQPDNTEVLPAQPVEEAADDFGFAAVGKKKKKGKKSKALQWEPEPESPSVENEDSTKSLDDNQTITEAARVEETQPDTPATDLPANNEPLGIPIAGGIEKKAESEALQAELDPKSEPTEDSEQNVNTSTVTITEEPVAKDTQPEDIWFNDASAGKKKKGKKGKAIQWEAEPETIVAEEAPFEQLTESIDETKTSLPEQVEESPLAHTKSSADNEEDVFNPVSSGKKKKKDKKKKAAQWEPEPEILPEDETNQASDTVKETSDEQATVTPVTEAIVPEETVIDAEPIDEWFNPVVSGKKKKGKKSKKGIADALLESEDVAAVSPPSITEDAVAVTDEILPLGTKPEEKTDDVALGPSSEPRELTDSRDHQIPDVDTTAGAPSHDIKPEHSIERVQEVSASDNADREIDLEKTSPEESIDHIDSQPAEPEEEPSFTLKKTKKDKKKAKKARESDVWADGLVEESTSVGNSDEQKEITEGALASAALAAGAVALAANQQESKGMEEPKSDDEFSFSSKKSKKDKKKAKKARESDIWASNPVEDPTPSSNSEEQNETTQNASEPTAVVEGPEYVETTQPESKGLEEPKTDDEFSFSSKKSKKDKKKAKKSSLSTEPWSETPNTEPVQSEESTENQLVTEEISNTPINIETNDEPSTNYGEKGLEATVPQVEDDTPFESKKSKKDKKKAKKAQLWDDVPSVEPATPSEPKTVAFDEVAAETSFTEPAGTEQQDADEWSGFATKRSKKDKKKAKKNSIATIEVPDNDSKDLASDALMDEPTHVESTLEGPSIVTAAEEAGPSTRNGEDPMTIDVNLQVQDKHHPANEDREASKELEVVQKYADSTQSSDTPKDLEFAATLAAGLAESGFDPNLVVNDPNFHRRGSPPGTVPEADPEEFFAPTKKKKGKKGKKARESDLFADESPATEPDQKLALTDGPPESDNFDAIISQGLTGTGFDPKLLEQATSSSKDASSAEVEGDASDFGYSMQKKNKKKKGKKSAAIDWTAQEEPSQIIEPNTDVMQEEAATNNDGLATPGHRAVSDKGSFEQDVVHSIDDNIQLQSPAANDQDLQETEPDQGFSVSAKKEKRKNKKKQRAEAFLAEESQISSAAEPESTETEPVTEVKELVNALPLSPELNPQENTSNASKISSVFPGLQRVKFRKPSPTQSVEGTDKTRRLSSNSGPSGFLHTSEISQSLPVAVGTRSGSSDHEFETIQESQSHSKDAIVVGAAAIGAATAAEIVHDKSHRDEPDWSFDSLNENEKYRSTVPDASHRQHEIVRDSGYQEGDQTPRSQSRGSMGSDLPEIRTVQSRESLRSRRSASPLHISTDTGPSWNLKPNKQREIGQDDKLHARTPSKEVSLQTPLQSTTKDRASPLFRSERSESRSVDPIDTPERSGFSPRMASPTNRLGLTSITEEADPRKRGKTRKGEDELEPVKPLDRNVTPRSARRSLRQQPSLSGTLLGARSVSNQVSTEELLDRLGSPAAIEDENDKIRPLKHRSSTRRISDQRPPSAMSSHSNFSTSHLRSPIEDLRSFSRTSNRSSTPTLRRIDRSMSGDLRAASRAGSAVSARASPKTIPFEPPPTPPSNDDDVIHASAARTAAMDDVFQGYGDVPKLEMSPTRPPGVRKRKSMHGAEMSDALRGGSPSRDYTRSRRSMDLDPNSMAAALDARDSQLRDKDAEINQIRAMLQPLQEEIDRLKQINGDLTEANRNLVDDANGRYGTLQAEHAQAREEAKSASRELEGMRQKHEHLTSGMRDTIEAATATALADKNAEILRLREELDVATEQIRALQVQIQSTRKHDFLTVRDEDYFDGACQKLCQHVQQWVLRFSKLSDNRVSRLSDEIKDEKIELRLDNAILDGSDVDKLLGDRIRRRDVFMSVVMTMVWEYVFTRYLFGMDREQRQKLKALEKILSEVGPPRAVAQWRATTLTLLSKRSDFAKQCQMDTEAVAHEIFEVLCALLPPPSSTRQQLTTSLQKVIGVAVDISIEMRTQRAEFIMLPPLQPEYDTNGDLVRKVHFNASLMNERSGLFSSNGELEQQRAVVKIVLFPLVVKKGDESGEGEEEIVVCPAQVLVHNDGGRSKKVVRVMSGAMEIDDPRRSSRMSLMSTAGESMTF